ncbi:MAG TPA: galactokinase [Candidatus Limnocylindria bacterium]|nr:galactokinase [Candidatus Limnocylindria bacterium]
MSVVASAPGRVNLIGEHTDYNGGFVLPVVLPRRVTVELTPRDDARVRVRSDALGEAEYALGEEQRGRGWIDRVQAITYVLAREGRAVPPDHHLRGSDLIRGFDARIRSDVPIGAGLASSAALAVALLRALREAFRLRIDDRAIAALAQRADHDFVGVRSGIMDQLVASLGRDGMPLLIDTRDLTVTEVALPGGCELLVVDSGVAHDNLAGAYNARRAECEDAAVRLGVATLRELDGPRPELPSPLDRRVRHVVSENARVLATVDALREGDLEGVGGLLDASHASLRDDYEVSSPELDLLVGIAQAQPEVLGARLTGAGFGGSIVALARRDGAAAARRIADEYTRRSGRRGAVILPA